MYTVLARSASLRVQTSRCLRHCAGSRVYEHNRVLEKFGFDPRPLPYETDERRAVRI